MNYFIVAALGILLIGWGLTLSMVAKKFEDYDRRINALEDEIISLAKNIAEISEQIDKTEELVKAHEEKLSNLDGYVGTLFNEAADRMGKEMSDGINQVLNFTPYGVR